MNSNEWTPLQVGWTHVLVPKAPVRPKELGVWMDDLRSISAPLRSRLLAEYYWWREVTDTWWSLNAPYVRRDGTVEVGATP